MYKLGCVEEEVNFQCLAIRHIANRILATRHFLIWRISKWVGLEDESVYVQKWGHPVHHLEGHWLHSSRVLYKSKTRKNYARYPPQTHNLFPIKFRILSGSSHIYI
uniref:Uncharacterized protein n=1 Tax=Pyxicephalus adspersus TaxID=30357 RepID=A0AAV3A5C8_PYXAD|nr:TPA: hypothetical protein GDO54_015401 [Pyxicephalus adspersus]